MNNIHHLERSLCKLRLTRVGAEWHALEKRALAEGWTPSRYLLTLCNEELLWRESEKLRRYKKEARLLVAKTLSEYDFSQVPELSGAQFRRSVKRQTGLMRVKTSCCSAPAGWEKAIWRQRSWMAL